MLPDTVIREHTRLQKIAREYRQRGYRVIVEPDANDLPEFLAPLPLDMVALGATENVVVEVRTQESLVDKPRLDAIAKALKGRSGWRYELIVTNPRDKTLLKVKDARLLATNDIRYRLNEARQLSEQEHGEAAFLMLWSALEAILRGLAQREQVAAEKLSIVQLVKTLFVYGLLDRSHYESLQDGLEIRTQITHGFKEQKSLVKSFRDLFRLAEELNEQTPISGDKTDEIYSNYG